MSKVTKKKIKLSGISPAVLDAAIKAKERDDAFIATLNPKQKKMYIEIWAHRLAEDLSKAVD